jgi:hypothetical protein
VNLLGLLLLLLVGWVWHQGWMWCPGRLQQQQLQLLPPPPLLLLLLLAVPCPAAYWMLGGSGPPPAPEEVASGPCWYHCHQHPLQLQQGALLGLLIGCLLLPGRLLW